MNPLFLVLYLTRLTHKILELPDVSWLLSMGPTASDDILRLSVTKTLSFDECTVTQAIEHVPEGGDLDIFVSPTPVYLNDAEEITRKLYEYAPLNRNINYTVLLEDPRQIVPGISANTGNPAPIQQPLCKDACKPRLGEYDVVAVGGTFDHMHIGHKLLLSMATYASSMKVIVGITVEELLANKKYCEYLETFEQRESTVKKFIRTLKPNMLVETYPLDNMFGPTTAIRKIDALVVSKETREGADKVNESRKKLKWEPLDIIEVGLIQSKHGKLSSTEIRHNIATAAAQTPVPPVQVHTE